MNYQQDNEIFVDGLSLEEWRKEFRLNEIDENTWFVAGVNISGAYPAIPRPESCLTYWLDDTDQSSYTLTQRLDPPPAVYQEPKSAFITDRPIIELNFGVYRIDKRVYFRCERECEVTLEHVPLEFVQSKQPRTFGIPKLLYHTQKKDWHYTFIEVPGRSLTAAWDTLTPGRKIHYAFAIADAIDEMASWKGMRIEGVDGSRPGAIYLSHDRVPREKPSDRFKYFHNVRANAGALGLTSSTPVFYHGNPAATTIFAEDEPLTGEIWIYSWDSAGCYRPEYIRSDCTLGRRSSSAISTVLKCGTMTHSGIIFFGL